MAKPHLHSSGQDHDGILSGLRALDGQNVTNDASRVLSANELERLKAKLAGGTFDILDVDALFEHIEEMAAQNEALVQKTSRGNDEDLADAQATAREMRASAS